MEYQPLDALLVVGAQDKVPNIDTWRHDGIRIDVARLDQFLDLGDRDPASSGHHRVEVLRGAVVDKVSETVALPRLDEGEISVKRLLEDVPATVDHPSLLRLRNDSAVAGRCEEAADTGATGAEPLGERPLWHEFHLELIRQELPLELLVLADIRRDHLRDLARLQQNAEAKVIDAGIVADCGEAFRALCTERLDEILRNPAETKPAHHDRRAVLYQGNGARRIRQHLVHDSGSYHQGNLDSRSVRDIISHMSTIDVSSLFSLKGKVALVTGGSRGIGRMIAEGYLQAGAKVYISARKKETCDRTADELSRVGDCVSLPADVSTTQGRAALVKTLSDNERALHILVNNAGANWGAPYDEFPEKGFHKVVDLNLIAVFFLTRDLTPLLERAGTADDPARVINIGSMDGVHVPTTIPTGVFAYSSSKAGVHHLSRHLAVELGPRHITVNAVAPGYFESKMTEEVLEQYGHQIRGACPMDRIGRPEEMAGVAIYLASRAGAYTNGAVIAVDGGTCIS